MYLEVLIKNDILFINYIEMLEENEMMLLARLFNSIQRCQNKEDINKLLNTINDYVVANTDDEMYDRFFDYTDALSIHKIYF